MRSERLGANGYDVLMSSSSSSGAATALIIGCGYLGRRLACDLLLEGTRVYGTTRRTHRAETLAQIGVRPLLMSVTERLTLTSLRPALETDELDVYYMVPPGRGDPDRVREVLIDGQGYVRAALRNARISKALLVSSTAVYGRHEGEVVDADTAPEPADERGRMQMEAERQWQGETGWPAPIVRLAGLYGPGRVIGEQAVRQGAPIVGDPDAQLNLIHVHDAARLLQAVMVSQGAGAIELGCDGAPVRRIEYYSYLAGKLGVTPPAVLDEEQAVTQLGVDASRLRGRGSKSCDAGVTMRRTGWRPQYASYVQGLDAIVPEHARALGEFSAS
ncbi:MAG: hypothetical protein CMJ18_04345 [Phycisphaeraceae bacterium]|nr:hypothetical protein [Phycisphaeraceae bacterium]